MQQTAAPNSSDLLPPAIQAQTRALVDMEVTSAARLATLEGEREALRKGLGHTSGDERHLNRDRISSLEAQISGEKSKLNRVRDELSQLQSTFAPQSATIQVQAGPLSKGLRLTSDQMVGMGSFLLLMPLMIAYAIRIVRRPAAALPQPVESERFARLEQAVDAIAIEIERIGESQRFQAKLSAEAPERELRA